MDTLGIRAHQGLADHALPELLLEHVLTDCVPVICGVAEVHVDEVITRVVPLGPCVWKAPNWKPFVVVFSGFKTRA